MGIKEFTVSNIPVFYFSNPNMSAEGQKFLESHVDESDLLIRIIEAPKKVIRIQFKKIRHYIDQIKSALETYKADSNVDAEIIYIVQTIVTAYIKNKN